MVAYARDGDDLVISTPGAAFKTLCIERDPRVSFCVINNAEPFNYVTLGWVWFALPTVDLSLQAYGKLLGIDL